ncbi:EAL domain-containing protein [Lactococcus garvieae]|uniref:EAL domain-containing protein n=1 Tax=Lactococcus garvieae TaxID=1363 RepID=UPI00288C65B7|nr:EAL domain-containing protein [Lactococcus garvieae]MDT2741539.1 EAL domain-containing protein [Lactococcus garvieae]
MTNSNTRKSINNLCFFRQKIYNVNDSIQEEYELLLREEVSGKYVFPEQLFDELMSDRKLHKLYIEKVSKILNDLLMKEKAIYSLNIDYQELYYSETLAFLESFNYKEKLKIELTERIPLNRSNRYSEIVPQELIKSIQQMGYDIALDDFLLGVNSFRSLIDLNPYISRIKLSTLEFKNILEPEQLSYYLLAVEAIIKQFDKEIVIEGVEEETLLKTFPKEWKQQSYYYSIPHRFY